MFGWAIAPGEARAEWPYATVVQDGAFEEQYRMETLLRQASEPATYGEVYVGYTYHVRDWGNDIPAQQLFLHAYGCDDAACSTATAGDSEQVGSYLWGGHLLHPSFALRRVGNNPIELTLVRAAKVTADCDGANGVGGPGTPGNDIVDQKSADLVAYELTNAGTADPFVAVTDWDVAVNSGGVCADHGMSVTRYYGGETWTCYTHTPDFHEDDVVSCNSSVGAAGGAWTDELTLTPPASGTLEDHPGFDLLAGNRIVATSNRDPNDHTNDQIRVHFPDHAAPQPILEVTGGIDWANHPSVFVEAYTVQMVWHRNQGDDAELMYAFCDSGGCDEGSEWDPSGPTPPQQVLVSGGDVQYPQIASKDGFTMIAYAQRYDQDADGDDPLDPYRVFVISRCSGDAWSAPELVYENLNVAEHQSMAFGRPGLVLNATDHVAHLALLDGLDAPTTEDPTEITNADVVWVRTGYTGC